MGRNGGRRPGAGRKKGQKNKTTILKDQARTVLENKILEKWDAIIETLFLVGIGGWKFENSRGVVYTKQPDPDTLFKLLEYGAGKPTLGDAPALPPGEGNTIGDKLAQILSRPSVNFVQNNTAIQVNNGEVSKPAATPQPKVISAINPSTGPKAPHIPIPLTENPPPAPYNKPEPAFPDILPNSNHSIRPAAPGVVPQSKVINPEAVLG